MISDRSWRGMHFWHWLSSNFFTAEGLSAILVQAGAKIAEIKLGEVEGLRYS